MLTDPAGVSLNGGVPSTEFTGPVWLGISRDPSEMPSLYVISINMISVSSALGTTPIHLDMRFDSDDNITEIMKIIRSNEVWGKSIDFVIVKFPNRLFEDLTILKLRDCRLATVSSSNSGTLHHWEIQVGSMLAETQK